MVQEDQRKKMGKICKTDIDEGEPKIKVLKLVEFETKS